MTKPYDTHQRFEVIENTPPEDSGAKPYIAVLFFRTGMRGPAYQSSLWIETLDAAGSGDARKRMITEMIDNALNGAVEARHHDDPPDHEPAQLLDEAQKTSERARLLPLCRAAYKRMKQPLEVAA